MRPKKVSAFVRFPFLSRNNIDLDKLHAKQMPKGWCYHSPLSSFLTYDLYSPVHWSNLVDDPIAIRLDQVWWQEMQTNNKTCIFLNQQRWVIDSDITSLGPLMLPLTQPPPLSKIRLFILFYHLISLYVCTLSVASWNSWFLSIVRKASTVFVLIKVPLIPSLSWLINFSMISLSLRSLRVIEAVRRNEEMTRHQDGLTLLVSGCCGKRILALNDQGLLR